MATGSGLDPGGAAQLTERVRQRLVEHRSAPSPVGPVIANDGRKRHVADMTAADSGLLTDSATLAQITDQLTAELSGAGPLEALLSLPGITDVLVNAPDRVWIDRGMGLELTAVTFDSDAAVRRLAVRLAARAGRRLDESMPFVDASLSDGTRLHAILPPLVAHPVLCLRVLARRRFSLADLVTLGNFSAPVGQLLTALIAARMTMLISGGTGTGKTTLLSALLGLVDPAERILTIEDAAELAVDHPHVIGLLARGGNVEGAGSIDLSQLVRQALRMRADRIVVGEFRGAEIVELLAALNTGHAGGAATVHANSVQDVPTRLTALGALAGLPAPVLAAQAASAIDILVHLRRTSSGARVLDQVALWPRTNIQPQVVWSAAEGVGPGGPALQERLIAAEVTVPQLLLRASR